jgi:hypothetical protein
MKFRAQYLLAAAVVASMPTVSGVAMAEEGNPSCLCPLSAVQSTATVGSIASVSGSVLVSHTASFVGAEAGSPISAGSRVVTGSKSSAGLLVGGSCSVSLGENSSATVVRQGDQLCVRVVGQETTASVKTDALSPRGAEYGQQGQQTRPRFGAPEGMALGAFVGAGLGAVLDDDDDDDDVGCVSAGC